MILHEWICGSCRIALAEVERTNGTDNKQVMQEILGDLQTGGIDLAAPATYFYQMPCHDLEEFDAKMQVFVESIHEDSDYIASTLSGLCTCEHGANGTLVLATQELAVKPNSPETPVGPPPA